MAIFIWPLFKLALTRTFWTLFIIFAMCFVIGAANAFYDCCAIYMNMDPRR